MRLNLKPKWLDSVYNYGGFAETAISQLQWNQLTRVNFYLFLLLFLTCQFFSYQANAKRQYLKIGKRETVASEGIRLRVFKDARSVPLPAVNTFTLRYSGSDKKIETYNPLELWKHDQHLVIWGNTLGFLAIAKMTLDIPIGIPRVSPQYPYVLKESYDRWKQEHEVTWTMENAEKWIRCFTGTEIDGKPEKVKGPRGCVTYHFKLKFNVDFRELYLVVRNTKPKQRYVFLYGVKPGIDFKKSSKAISQSFNSIVFSKYQRKTETRIAKEKLRRSKPLEKEDWTPEFINSRRKVISNIKNLEDWWYVETDGFIIANNLKHKKTISKIKIDLERCRNVYKKYFPIQGDKLKAVSVVRIFRDRVGYVNYVGNTFQWTSGVWVPMKKELVISSSDWLKGKKQREQMLKLIYHEGFHQYIHYVTGEVSTSLWFNEGHATYFEGLDFKGRNRAEIGLNEERYDHFREMLKQDRLYISNLIRMGWGEFYSEPRLKDNYALAWALVYFLNKGVPILKTENNYGKILPSYYEMILKGINPSRASVLAWKDIDRDAFNRDFRRFWESNRMVSRSKRLDPLSRKR